MIGLQVTVPVASWRKGHAREFLETEAIPPPATCYGALLSLIGETDRERHRGSRVTAGLLNHPSRSIVLRSLWQIKDRSTPQGVGQNAGPDLQELVLGAELILWCDSRDEPHSEKTLEARTMEAIQNPSRIERFGGWSLGESTHLINDARLIDTTGPVDPCLTFLVEAEGTVTLPVWVDHVGSTHTVYAVGRLQELTTWPEAIRIPQIPLE